ncbi:hypothetical protein BGW38_002931 [Lunasporangiospora selenospora]|uniref:Uncharacterized protein n=1 Tax=Lunasporangiospora selenospora TaxID=979761 RepID=A0A9P6G0P0_9FUNG|nr:hypothetical protein BGW38_002931 [Lunasporangiospora selenospora]
MKPSGYPFQHITNQCGLALSITDQSILLCFLRLILGDSVPTGQESVCLILSDPAHLKFSNSPCVFTTFVGVMIMLGGAALFGMDYITWKRSERFKGKRASVAALLITPTMTFFSFSTAIVVGLGLKKFCNGYYVNGALEVDRCYEQITQLKYLQSGLAVTTLAGFLFMFYGASEYVQYRKRHVHGDKW